jgi:RNA polymerase sigma-70 factor, ECF subfamily
MGLSPAFEIPQTDKQGTSTVADEGLMERITERQQSALSELYSRHAQTLRGMIGKVIREESEADDVLQESFLQIWREAASYCPDIGRPLGWAVTIARRRAIDRLRRRASYRRAKQRFEDETRPQAGLSFGNAVAAEIAGSDLRRFLDRQMQRLPDGQREAVELAYFGGLTQREIAEATRTPLGTVKTRLQLGLQKLTQAIRPLYNKI